MEIKTKASVSGSLKVSEEVIAKIAILAASEVGGVALEGDGRRLARARKPGPDIIRQMSRPVRVRLAKETAEIDVSIITLQGFKAGTVGEHVQKAVKTAVQNMTGITVSKVNIKIEGIRLTEA